MASNSHRRRNGRQAACDPCRSRKVACDHTRPVCLRCQRREQSARCVYSQSTPRPLGVPSRNQSQPDTPGSALSSISQYQQSPIDNPTRIGTGYLGEISYNSVLNETIGTLSLASGPTPTYGRLDRLTRQFVSFEKLPAPIREMAIYVLQTLPGQANEQMVFKDSSFASTGFMHIAVDRIIASINSLFETFAAEDEAVALNSIAEILCHNTVQPWRDVTSSSSEFLDQFCGTSLRWEALGILWLHMNRVSDPVDSPLTRRVAWKDGKESHETCRTSVDYIIEISRYLCDGNDLLVDICRRQSALHTVVDGDGTYCSSLLHGLNVTMATYLGLHAQQGSADFKPSLCSEYKRRLFAQTFISDKLFVCFTGRPPLISRRFCKTPLPLDLSDEELAADPMAFEQAVRALDANGWNTKGRLYSSTLIRARYLGSFIRDELIEIALGDPNLVTIDQLLSLEAKHSAFDEQLPAWFKYSPQDLEQPDSMNDQRFGKILLRLEHVQSLFLIQRLLLRHGYPDSGDLLITSFDMLAMTLCLNQRDRSAGQRQRHAGWLFISYAVPAAGVLCVELLRPTFKRSHPKDARLTRSSIIQKLSLVVAFLDWMRPSAPNGTLCADSKLIIQRVLDEHLNAPDERVGGEMLESVDWGYPMQLDFNFDLLDTFDWLRPGGEEI
ncbi:unnamed protein product [Clonostachys byssicola]|uniref:Zn(2)-C6 fungal-type domain-containing protein n=1 Tax=Clonostachys byssicola TaxID=160290 RepID=A0A9N9V079_9HYPO|nr:unnamed protein product [Clonostachys byssicola]